MSRVACVVVLLGLFLSACVGVQTTRITAQMTTSLAGKSLHIKREDPDPFLPMSYTNGALGVIGVAAAIERGKDYVKKFPLVDPSHGLEDRLSKYVIGKYQLAGQGQVLNFVNQSAPGNMVDWAKKNGVQGLLLDVQTTGWQYIYDGFNFSDYLVRYAGRYTLTDLGSGQVVSSHFCNKDTKTLKGGQTYSQDDLVANGGTLLKQLLGELSEACFQDIVAKAL